MLKNSSITYPALQSAMGDADDSHHRPYPNRQRSTSPNDLFLLEPVKSSRRPSPSEPKVTKVTGITEANAEVPDVDKKPPGLSYIALISMAIQASKSQKKLLSEIYQWIADRYPYYNMKDKSWRNSIRHNLSLNECFVKSGRSENGKGNYWSIHPANIDDFARGDFRRRRARRRVRICDKDLQMLCSNDGQSRSPPPVHKMNMYDGYIPMASTTVPASFMTSLGPEPMKCQPDWYQPDYYPCKNYDYKPFQPITSPRDTVCHYQSIPNQVNTDYLSYGNTSPYHSAPNSHGSNGQAESKLNVNVSVNVSGNSSPSKQTSPVHHQEQQHQQQQQQEPEVHHQLHQQQHQQQHQHSLFMPHHFQSAYSSHYSQIYGTSFQDQMSSGLL